MITTTSLPFLPLGRALRRHRTTVGAALAAEPAAQLLPTLLTLPLGADPLPDPAAILALPTSVALLGPPGSGRTLALLQVAERWSAHGGDSPVLYLPLLECDAPTLPPRAVVAKAAQEAGFPSSLADGARPGILLLDDWELLPADRRALWQGFLSGAPRWPALRAVVALPSGQPWPELRTLVLPPPDDGRVALWLAHLLPDHDPAPILAALGQAPLSGLRESPADLALLALIYPLAGIPGTRAELYEQAYALVRPVLEGEQQAPAPAEPAGQPPVRIGRAVLRHYRLARGLAGGADLDALAALPPTERIATAPLVAGLLNDPTPVLSALWGKGEPDHADLRALTACARDSAGRAPQWELRLVERLSAPEAAPTEQALLADLAPALAELLATAATVDARRASAALAAAGGALVDTGPLLQLVDNPAAPATLRWQAADILAARPPAPALLAAVPAGADVTALAARSMIAGLSGPEGRALLAASPLRAGLEALLRDPEASARAQAPGLAVVADTTLPEELRAAALAATGDLQAAEQHAATGSPALRRAALAVIAASEASTALDILARLLDARSGATSSDLLDTIARQEHPAATGLLTRAALDESQPLEDRLHAVDLLAGRGPHGMRVLERLLPARGLPVTVRAAAAGHLGRLGTAGALPTLRNLLESQGPLLLRQAAARALGALGRRPELRNQAVAALITGLRRVGVDTALAEQIVRALAHTSADAALPTLAALLAPRLEESLRAAWLRRVPELAERSAPAWLALELPEENRLALIETMADGDTTADPPTSLGELVARQAARIAATAATALADLASSRPELREPVIRTLRGSIAGEHRAEVARATLAALARVSDPATELWRLLDDQGTPLTLRWLAIERLGAAPGAGPALAQRLASGQDDTFLRITMAELVVAHGEAAGIAVLRRLALAVDEVLPLRIAVVAALGRSDDPGAAATLGRLIADHGAPTDLRVAAADALQPRMDDEQQLALRQLLRASATPPELAAALARALARAGDREALPALLRAAQSGPGATAVESIAAIAQLGDASVAPLLVRISQSPIAAPGVRLAAVAALLRLCGAEYLTLLQEYLASPAPPLRLQAYAALAAALPDDERLIEPLADPDAPLPLRLQALSAQIGRRADEQLLGAVLTNPGEQAQLRLEVAAALATNGSGDGVEALAVVLAPDGPEAPLAPPLLRRRCIDSLRAIASRQDQTATQARAHLTRIATDSAQPAEHRHWAAVALLSC